MEPTELKLVECPRDAMQGWETFIPTEQKIKYLNKLLQVGFHTLDFGSFVSASAVPQMRDTAEVLAGLELGGSKTRLLAIVASERGADDALIHTQIDCLGYPFSISETFQQKNTRRSIADSEQVVYRISELCKKAGRDLVIYLSMAFGNPYGDEYSEDLACHWAEKLHQAGTDIIYLADTVGNAGAGEVSRLFKSVAKAIPQADLGLHLHAAPENANALIQSALDAGCRRLDSSIGGIGGCPFAAHNLTGNLPTEQVVDFLVSSPRLNVPHFNQAAFAEARELSRSVFF